ncbi:MAG: hypothetical protein MMC33_008055 [Icmadophila ericetorum]|nr:hypothetical protein [Icmadophila ericetorum]
MDALSQRSVSNKSFSLSPRKEHASAHIPSRTSSQTSSKHAQMHPPIPYHDDVAGQPTPRKDSYTSDKIAREDGMNGANGISYNAPVYNTGQPAGQPKRFSKGRALDVRPEDYDLPASMEDANHLDAIEAVSQVMFCTEHLRVIFAEPSSLLKFTSFLTVYRPNSIPTLIYYLDAMKALKAISYANSIAQSLESMPAQDLQPIAEKASSNELEANAEKAFKQLVDNDLPAYVTYLYIQVVKASIMKLGTGTALETQLDNQPDGFAEVFCLTDPSRPDNPIIFASEAFHQMTQYSMNYIVGRNCRFLQGPNTNVASLKRIKDAVQANQGHCEVILNYRRDGAPFLNLLMHAPLYDHFGKIRYFMGAQVDVSGVMEQSPELESLQRLLQKLDQDHSKKPQSKTDGHKEEGKSNFQELVEMLDMQELKVVRKWEDRILQEQGEDPNGTKVTSSPPRRPGMVLRDHSTDLLKGVQSNSRGKGLGLGMYNYYLLVRPYPSLNILFASPSLSSPGMVHTPIMNKIGGNAQIREELTQALAEGREVTAKVRWLVGNGEEGQNRWIYFTPLIGSKGQIGVWVAILEDDDNTDKPRAARVNQMAQNGMVRVASIIEEEPDDFEAKPGNLRPPRSDSNRNSSSTRNSHVHSPKISWSGPEVPPEQHAIIDALSLEMDDDYEPLEERLRKKRERDAAMMLDQSGLPVGRKTYKSLAPASFMSVE